MVDKWLLGVRAIRNVDTNRKEGITTIELQTNQGTDILNIPYKKEYRVRKLRFNYMMGIRQFCQARNIDYRKYFHLIHKDCI